MIYFCFVSVVSACPAGFDVVGLFMKNWDIRDEKGACTTDEDRKDAEFVCRILDIPLYEVDFVKQYWHEVFT